MTAQRSAESKGKRTPVVKFFRGGSLRVLLWGDMGALFVFLLFGCAFADDAYPEIPFSKMQVIGDIIYLWKTLKPGCGETTSCSGTCTHFAGFFLQRVATCARLCAEIPAEKQVKQKDGYDMVQVSARNSREGEYLDCLEEGRGPFDPGECSIGLASWEGGEYDRDTHRYCVRIKNWGAERARDFSVTIELEEDQDTVSASY